MRTYLAGLLACCALSGPVCTGQTSPTGDPAFREFISWYKTYQGSFMPPAVAKAYSEKLAQDGLDKSEIDKRMAALWKGVEAMPAEFAALHFDHIYTDANSPFRKEASQYLARMVEGRKPGKALDVAMGQGRNALYLASKGWDVTGYDISEEGLRIARESAAQAKLRLNAVMASHETFDYGREQWDLIVEAFAFTNLADPGYRRRVIDSLKPGGLLIIEGFGNPTDQVPKNVLFESFRELRVVEYEDQDDVADWGLRKIRLSRIAAQK